MALSPFAHPMNLWQRGVTAGLDLYSRYLRWKSEPEVSRTPEDTPSPLGTGLGVRQTGSSHHRLTELAQYFTSTNRGMLRFCLFPLT